MKKRRPLTPEQEAVIQRTHYILDEIQRDLRAKENRQRGQRAARKGEG
jgi:predicted transcriptional regulator of viral defense system